MKSFIKLRDGQRINLMRAISIYYQLSDVEKENRQEHRIIFQIPDANKTYYKSFKTEQDAKDELEYFDTFILIPERTAKNVL